ncbi:hypothetical protein [Streptomyces sp. Ag109_O5-1]|nr:hypothetical protein [Streptomyces sp. Ag109_O5-1]
MSRRSPLGAIFGPLGVLLGSIFTLVMGNATSGGVLPPSFLPG